MGGGPWEVEGAGSRAAAARSTEVNRTCLRVGHSKGEDCLVFSTHILPSPKTRGSYRNIYVSSFESLIGPLSL